MRPFDFPVKSLFEPLSCPCIDSLRPRQRTSQLKTFREQLRPTIPYSQMVTVCVTSIFVSLVQKYSANAGAGRWPQSFGTAAMFQPCGCANSVLESDRARAVNSQPAGMSSARQIGSVSRAAGPRMSRPPLAACPLPRTLLCRIKGGDLGQRWTTRRTSGTGSLPYWKA